VRPPSARRLLPLLGVLLAAPGARPARADDPPGFPSTGGGAPAAGKPTVDELARQRMAALRKFVRDKESDPKYAEHEHAGGACRIDHAKKLVTLTFSADGVLHCRLSELAEGYRIEVYVLTVQGLYASGDHYGVSVKTGEPLKAAPIHGSSSDAKAALAVLSGLGEDYSAAEWWKAPRTYGPYHFDGITLTISLDEAGVEAQTQLKMAPLYLVNLSVVALAGPGVSSYAIVDGKIAESTNKADLDYYVGVHVFPLSWNRNGHKQLRPGRYYSDRYDSWADRISLVVGANLSHPREGGYLGAALELYNGIAITGGWQPRKLHALDPRSAVGDPITGDAVPTNSTWKLANWGVGLSVSSTILKPLGSLATR